MHTAIFTASWHPMDLLNTALALIFIFFCLGFSLWKALSDTGAQPYWHIASILICLGIIYIGVIETQPTVSFLLDGIGHWLVASGVAIALLGMAISALHRFNLYRHHDIYQHWG